MTNAQAENELRRLIAQTVAAPARERVTVAEAGGRHLDHVAALGRKRSNADGLRVDAARALAPFFGSRRIDALSADDVERFIAAKRREGRAPKSVRNYVGVLHGICACAVKRRWADSNPCAAVELPRVSVLDADLRFLSVAQVEALLRAIAEDHLGPTERALYLTAAMTGLRQGELLALRWRDVDWVAGRVARPAQPRPRGVRTPKGRRGTRSVPLADRVAAALEQHFRRSAHTADHDLVFPRPTWLAT